MIWNIECWEFWLHVKICTGTKLWRLARNFKIRTSPMGKTRKSKTTTAWWPASHFFALYLEAVWTMAAAIFAVLDSNGSEQFRHLWHYCAIWKTKAHCMVAGMELGQYYTNGHKMSNQQWEKPDLPQLKPGSLAKTVGYLQLRRFTLLHTVSI